MTSEVCHVTETQLDELLMGLAGPELQAHCAACPACRDRVSTFSASLEPFHQATLAWSEARSHTFSRDLSGRAPAWRLTAPALRSTAAMVLFLVVGGLTIGAHRRFDTLSAAPSLSAVSSLSAAALEAGVHTPPQSFTPDARAQQIAQDNAMLQAIDAELTEPEFGPSASPDARTAPQPASAQERD